MGPRMENVYIMGVHWKIQFLGVLQKTNTLVVGNHLKKGLGWFTDLREGLSEKEGWCYWGGVGVRYPNANYAI